jgi:hypothetical protein
VARYFGAFILVVLISLQMVLIVESLSPPRAVFTTDEPPALCSFRIDLENPPSPQKYLSRASAAA